MIPNGEKVKKLRENRGWTQDELAAKAGVSLRTVQRLEAGRSIRLPLLEYVAQTLEVPIQEIRAPRPAKEADPPQLLRMMNGNDLARVVGVAEASSFDHDNLETQEEAQLVGGVLQALHDWGDIWGDLEPQARAEATVTMTGMIRDLEAAGFLIFGTTIQRKWKWTAPDETVKSCDLTVAMVRIVRSNNPTITSVRHPLHEMLCTKLDRRKLKSGLAQEFSSAWSGLLESSPKLKADFAAADFPEGSWGEFLRIDQERQVFRESMKDRNTGS